MQKYVRVHSREEDSCAETRVELLILCEHRCVWAVCIKDIKDYKPAHYGFNSLMMLFMAFHVHSNICHELVVY